MEPVTAEALRALMQGLGERCSQPATLYLLGGRGLLSSISIQENSGPILQEFAVR